MRNEREGHVFDFNTGKCVREMTNREYDDSRKPNPCRGRGVHEPIMTPDDEPGSRSVGPRATGSPENEAAILRHSPGGPFNA
jgi:hypothetical protein